MVKKRMAGRGKRSKEKERQWRKTLAEQRRSGESVRGFCRERGLQETSFYWWRRQIERRDREAEVPRSKALPAEASVLAPVVVMGERDELTRSVAIEIEFRGGTVVRVLGNTTGEQLGMVLGVLERSRC